MSKYKVLLADDDPGLRKLVGTTLGTDDFLLYHAADGEETLSVARAERPDLILLDIGLPKLNGYEAARRIREQPWGKEMVLVAITGWGQEEDKRRATEAGFDAHLTKPADPTALQVLLAQTGSTV